MSHRVRSNGRIHLSFSLNPAAEDTAAGIVGHNLSLSRQHDPLKYESLLA